MVLRNNRQNGHTPEPILNGNGNGIYAHIIGWGKAVPQQVMTNDDLSAFVETDDEWIQTRTGIRERRIASENESSTTLGYQAAQAALEVADILPVDIDLIICATSSAENNFPATANLIQDWLGASRAGAFDLSAACAGFVYGVDMASNAIRSGSIETALIVGTETMSRIIDWQDRSTCILFGDGAGAVVLQASDTPGGILSSILRSDGSGNDFLALPQVSHREIAAGEDENQYGHKLNKIYMVGREVFRFATRVVEESLAPSG